VLGARELLDGGDDDERLGLEQVAGTPAHARRLARSGQEAVEGGIGLGEELVAVREEQHARPATGLAGDLGDVVGGEPCLAEPGGEHDQRAPASLFAG
jgi:hypothetical protein